MGMGAVFKTTLVKGGTHCRGSLSVLLFSYGDPGGSSLRVVEAVHIGSL